MKAGREVAEDTSRPTSQVIAGGWHRWDVRLGRLDPGLIDVIIRQGANALTLTNVAVGEVGVSALHPLQDVVISQSKRGGLNEILSRRVRYLVMDKLKWEPDLSGGAKPMWTEHDESSWQLTMPNWNRYWAFHVLRTSNVGHVGMIVLRDRAAEEAKAVLKEKGVIPQRSNVLEKPYPSTHLASQDWDRDYDLWQEARKREIAASKRRGEGVESSVLDQLIHRKTVGVMMGDLPVIEITIRGSFWNHPW